MSAAASGRVAGRSLQPLAAASRPGQKPAAPAGLEPRQKIILAALAAAVLAFAGAIGWNLRPSARALAELAQAEVTAGEVEVLAGADAAARRIATLRRGSRVHLAALPDSAKQQWLEVRLPEAKGRPASGWVRVAELGNWSSQKPDSALELLKLFAPPDTGNVQELQAYLLKLDAFTERFGITPQGPEGNFEKARVHLALARSARQAGDSGTRWAAHLDTAAGQLAMASADRRLAKRIEEARRELDELREAAWKPPPPPGRAKPLRR